MNTVDSISSENNITNTGSRPLCGQLIYTYKGDSSTTINNNNISNSSRSSSTNHSTISHSNSRTNDTDKSKNDPFEVVETVMNIQPELPSSSSNNNIQDNNNIQINKKDFNSFSLSRSPSLTDSTSEGYCSAYTTETESTNDQTNEFGLQLGQNDFNRLYQCVPRTDFQRYPMISQHRTNINNNNPPTHGNDLRRFSEPQIFHNLYSKIDQNSNNYYNATTNNNMENIHEYDHKHHQPLRRVATINGGPSELMYHTTFNDIDVNLDCPCSKHHHRRNSIAIRFNKALYKKL
ncbi:similar to Saccharomyces cerevisiae YNR014W Putative protein of unknown function [Maudiozyma barnettii]|uniref:Uncharacterized protein n=1 Tax=Maudiozyma barnettii TaxID=61262 RepID=A0A8H2VBN8_9SACH|nr:uncharacterized protein KABA2_01S10142 [Kazachstania barnettii]CAB4252284.1 similar to Saccharomyces cerevisiae YNR014W Putative protein of unknown function [Kazachstania barnettii]CAD1778987.1 similar to Saccharomyces cerevisiae YNR014W Putative protein of unknown function [Kazachstania barnettii]